MTRLFLAAGVAALAITAPAAPSPAAADMATAVQKRGQVAVAAVRRRMSSAGGGGGQAQSFQRQRGGGGGGQAFQMLPASRWRRRRQAFQVRSFERQGGGQRSRCSASSAPSDSLSRTVAAATAPRRSRSIAASACAMCSASRCAATPYATSNDSRSAEIRCVRRRGRSSVSRCAAIRCVRRRRSFDRQQLRGNRMEQVRNNRGFPQRARQSARAVRADPESRGISERASGQPHRTAE